MHRLLRHLRSQCVGYIALFVALSFTPLPGYAAALIGTRDLKDAAVTTSKLHNGAVTTPKIAAKARGFRTVVVRQATAYVQPNAVEVLSVNCLANEVAIGGGLEHPTFASRIASSYASVGGEPVAPGSFARQWTTKFSNDESQQLDITAQAVCVSK